MSLPAAPTLCHCPAPRDQRPSLLPWGAAGPVRRRGPSGGGWLQSCPLRPRTVVGKSRTTGSHDLTSVSSTIAKNGGRQAAAAGQGAEGAEGAERPPPLLRKRQGQLAWSRDCPAGGTLPTARGEQGHILPVGSCGSPALLSCSLWSPTVLGPYWDHAGTMPGGMEGVNAQATAQTWTLSPPTLGGTLEGTSTPGSPLPGPYG